MQPPTPFKPEVIHSPTRKRKFDLEDFDLEDSRSRPQKALRASFGMSGENKGPESGTPSIAMSTAESIADLDGVSVPLARDNEIFQPQHTTSESFAQGDSKILPPLIEPTGIGMSDSGDDLSKTPTIKDPSESLLIARLTSVFQNKDHYRKLLHCDKSDAQFFLDCFQQLLDLQDLDPLFRKDLCVATQRLAKLSRLYPEYYELNGIKQLDEYPVVQGGFADIYRAMFRGKLVCLKVLRLYQNKPLEDLLKATSKEAILWRQLSHANVLTFIGVYRLKNTVSIVTEWMENGDLHMYLNHNPAANRPILASDVARGVSYLHENDVVHGDLKGPNILVDDAGHARVADFGISSISGSKIIAWSTQSSISSTGGSTRWQAPELFTFPSESDDDNETKEVVKNTFQSDIYALGCVFIEIFTGEVPFASITIDSAVMLRVISGVHPARPQSSSRSWADWGLTEDIWACMEDCWKKEPSQRPTAAIVVQRLSADLAEDTRQESDNTLPYKFRQAMSKACDMAAALALLNRTLDFDGQDSDVPPPTAAPDSNSTLGSSYDNLKPQPTRDSDPSLLLVAQLTSVFQNKDLEKKLLQCKPWDTQKFLNCFQQLLDLHDLNPHFRNKLKFTVHRLSAASGLYPVCYDLRDIQQLWEHLVNAGVFADVYRAVFQGKYVCLKIIRLRPSQVERFLETTFKKTILWRQLSHPNILTFIGLYRLQNKIAIVTEWMENGNINMYLEQNPTAHRPRLASDVARGLAYLHDNNLVHVNLKGSNIIVDNAGRARLADFAISSVTELRIISWLSESSSLSNVGSVRWQAPELFSAESGNDDNITVVKNTFASDVYALSCAFVEIFTGRVPFASIEEDPIVISQVTSGVHPSRPPASSQSWAEWGLTEEIWSCMEDCWEMEPSQRPTAAIVVQRLSDNLTEDTRQDSDDTLPAKFRREMSKAYDMVGALADLNRTLADAPLKSSFPTGVTGSKSTLVPTNVDSKSQPTSDPSILIARLKSVFRNRDLYRKLLHCESLDAQMFLDCFQQLLDLHDLDRPFRYTLCVATQRLSSKSRLYPAVYAMNDVKQIGDFPIASGWVADIYKAMYQGKVVCLKAARIYEQSRVDLGRIVKDAILWRQLSHPNIVKFIGICHFRGQIAIVTEWMENGDLHMYLNHNPAANRPILASDVARGVSYLHKNDVVHGDLKGPNILVDDAGHARVAGFGHSSISDPSIMAWSSQPISSKGGSVRWQAPELFSANDDEYSEVNNTFASDVYALGCVFVEVFTGQIPFADISNDVTVLVKVQSGIHPARPPASSPSWMWGLTEEIWTCMEDCWRAEPSERPAAAEVVQRLTANLEDVTQQDSDTSNLTAEFRQQMSEAIDLEGTLANLNRVLGSSA